MTQLKMGRGEGRSPPPLWKNLHIRKITKNRPQTHLHPSKQIHIINPSDLMPENFSGSVYVNNVRSSALFFISKMFGNYQFITYTVFVFYCDLIF